MVIQYYKGYVPKSILLETSCTNKNGTTAYHMVETLKQFGFSASGVRLEIEKSEKLYLPCIAHVTLDGYDHFVVIYEIHFAKNKIVIADPARQILKLSIEEFKTIYNQIFINFYPIQNIPVYSKTCSLFSYTLYTIWKNWKIFMMVLFISILVLIFSIVGTFAISILLSVSKTSWIYYLFFFLFLEIFKVLFSFIRNLLYNKLQSKLTYTLMMDTYSKVMRLPYIRYHNLPTGDFMARMQDINWVQEAIHSVALILFFDGILFLLSLLFLLYLQPLLLCPFLLLLVGYSLLIFFFRPIYHKKILQLEQTNTHAQTFMLDSMHSFEMVKGLSMTEKIIKRFQTYYTKYISKLYQFQKHTQLEQLVKDILESLGYFSVLGIGLYLYWQGTISIGMIFTYQLLFSYLMNPMIQVVDYDFMLERAKSAFNRIMNLSSDKKMRTGKKELIHTIACKNLSYSYQERDFILNSLTLEWNLGQKILCIGESGSGKSTLLKCIKGYYETEENQILINGEDINHYDFQYLDQNILYLSQHETLFMGSIYENITIGESFSDDKLNEILKICEIDSIIGKNPLGHHMLLDENGLNLSGGQRGQIILARTLMRPFQVLFIDEGFGQMDIHLERRILKRIFERFKDQLIVIISHRTDNSDLYDQVIRMDQGKIVEVLERNGVKC